MPERELKWGKVDSKITETGFCCTIHGVQHVKWEASTAYFDADTQGGAIFTEVKMGKAPFEYSLKTRKNIQPGQI
ncbi:hypothetical protein D3C76_1611140 [compost metagenome]